MIKDTVQFMDYFLSTKPKFVEANPGLPKRMHELRSGDAHYLAHEYFNQDWCPMYFADMGDWLKEAELEYACSARYVQNIPLFNLTDEQEKFLEKLADPMLKESIFDFMGNIQFRWDCWVKAPRELGRKEQTASLRDQRFLLRLAPEDISFKVQGGQEEIELDQAVYKPIVELMSDFQPRSMGEMEQELAGKNIKWPQLLQAVFVLAGKVDLEVVQDEATVEQAKGCSKRLNAFLCELSRKSNEILWLASPVTGGGCHMNTVEQLFLEHIAQGNPAPPDLAAYAWGQLSATGRKVLKDGNPLETEEKILAELVRQAEKFQAKRLPVLKALGIA